jgi:phosphohistidine phosphatase SixA
MSALYRFLLIVCAVGMLPAAMPAQSRGDKLVFIVRHAEKANATDPDPSLSEAGRARAAALAAALRDAQVTDILVTPRKRTQETAAVVADARQLIAHVVPLNPNTAEHVAAVAAAVRQAKGNAVLVVGHSNTVTGIIAALGAPKLPDLCDAQYANLFIVRLPARGAPSLIRTQYGAPDPSDAGSCAAAAMKP